MPQEQELYDLAIIGGGPAGYTSAFEARKQGLSVVLFEKDKIGGVCLNKGCIPTKAILHSAELYEEMKCAQDLGISAENLSFDYEKIIEHKDKIVEKLRKNLELALKNAGVKVVYKEVWMSGGMEVWQLLEEQRAGRQEGVSEGRKFGGQEVRLFNKSSLSELSQSQQTDTDLSPYRPIALSPFLITANDEIFKCKKLIIATGSEPKDFPTLRFDHEFVLNSDDILNLKKLPKNILIIGSGAIGIEWARIFSAFDVEVSIVETAEHLLPIADIEVSKRIERIFKSKKIKMYLSNTVEKIEPPLSKGGVCEADGGILTTTIPSKQGKVYLKSGEILEPECVLLAVGRKPVEAAKQLSSYAAKLDNSETLQAQQIDKLAYPPLEGGSKSLISGWGNISDNNLSTVQPFNPSTKNDLAAQPPSCLAALPTIQPASILGDACGKIQLAHFAIKQAIKEVSGIDFDETLVPSVVYGNPEIAWVGKREQDLEEGTYQKSNLLISALGKSHCDNSTDGFIKILSQNGKILGAHIVSKEASSLIQQITIAMQNSITIDDIKKVCFAHPTYSEGIFESIMKF